MSEASESNGCELCGRPIPPGAGYVVRIDVFADPEPPPMTADDIAAADLNKTLSELMRQIDGMSAEDLQDGVHRRFEYRLCGACQKSYLANPLGMPRTIPVGKN